MDYSTDVNYVTEAIKSDKTAYMKVQKERAKSNFKDSWSTLTKWKLNANTKSRNIIFVANAEKINKDGLKDNCLFGGFSFQFEEITDKYIWKSFKCIKSEATDLENINLQMRTVILPYFITGIETYLQ